MQTENQESILNRTQKFLIITFFALTIFLLFIFRNLFFQPTMILKSFSELSIDPEIAFKNNKPTFLEFYAEWCEVCKEMAPKVSALRDEYGNDINFVFLNVDNAKWQNYIKKFNVNGIPQVNLFNNEGNLEATFIGKQEETTIKEYLENLNKDFSSQAVLLNLDTSLIKKNNNFLVSPRSHG